MIFDFYASALMAVVILHEMNTFTNELSHSVRSLNIYQHRSCMFPQGHYNKFKIVIAFISIFFFLGATAIFIWEIAVLVHTNWIDIYPD